MVTLRNVVDLDKYYERLNIGVTMSKMWNTLQTKAEYGSDRSEKGYQQVAKSMAGTIARGLDLNPNLAEILTMCRGSFFPAYGKEGMRVIKQYLKEHNINISEADLAREFVEYDLDQSGNTITPEFDGLLKELFDESVTPTTPEVQLARLCGETIDKVKLVERNSNINQVNLLYSVSKDVESASLSAGRPTPSAKLDELVRTVPKQQERISDVKTNNIYKDLDDFIEFSGKGKMDGVYEYIGTDEMEI